MSRYQDVNSVKSIGIAGTGTIGASWAAYFLAQGFKIRRGILQMLDKLDWKTLLKVHGQIKKSLVYRRLLRHLISPFAMNLALLQRELISFRRIHLNS